MKTGEWRGGFWYPKEDKMDEEVLRKELLKQRAKKEKKKKLGRPKKQEDPILLAVEKYREAKYKYELAKEGLMAVIDLDHFEARK